jgi:hypothetical protein
MSDEPNPPPASAPDDDLAGLPTPARPKSPILALVVIALAGVLLWHLRADIGFALAGRTPHDLGDARSLAARGVTLSDNSYVTVTGQPERRYALNVEPRGERSRQGLFRLLGAGTGLFVRAADTSERVELVERWTGRLRRFDAMPWAPALRDYYAKETEVTRYVALDSIGASSDGPLRDRTGAPLTLAADTPLVVDVDFPGELKVYLSKDKMPSLADARHELERLKLAPSPGSETPAEFVFTVPMPEARKNEIVSALSDRGLVFQPREERYRTTRGELRRDGDTLVAGQERVPWARVKAVGAPAPLVVGPGAFILVEGESPSALWWAPLLAVLLVAFAAFNVWYLVRSFRART